MYASLGLFHAACGTFALLFGAANLLLRKGTRAHVRIGWAYTVSMVLLNASAFCIYKLTGGFNLFHVLAALSLITLTVGIVQVIARRRLRNWLWRHYQYMCWTYIGLLAATCNEAFVRVPLLQQLTAMTATWLPLAVMAALVLTCGTILFAKQPGTLSRYRELGGATAHDERNRSSR